MIEFKVDLIDIFQELKEKSLIIIVNKECKIV